MTWSAARTRPIARAGAELLGGYSLAELATIRRFVDDALALQARMTEALLERTRKRGRGLATDRSVSCGVAWIDFALES